LHSEDAKGAHVACVSLPVPRGIKEEPSLEGLSSQSVPVGYWPEDMTPRRYLVWGVAEVPVPHKVRVVWGKEERAEGTSQVDATLEVVESDYTKEFHWKEVVRIGM